MGQVHGDVVVCVIIAYLDECVEVVVLNDETLLDRKSGCDRGASARDALPSDHRSLSAPSPPISTASTTVADGDPFICHFAAGCVVACVATVRW